METGATGELRKSFNGLFLQGRGRRGGLYSWGTVGGDPVDGQFGCLLDLADEAVPSIGTIADPYPVEGASK